MVSISSVALIFRSESIYENIDHWRNMCPEYNAWLFNLAYTCLVSFPPIKAKDINQTLWMEPPDHEKCKKKWKRRFWKVCLIPETWEYTFLVTPFPLTITPDPYLEPHSPGLRSCLWAQSSFFFIMWPPNKDFLPPHHSDWFFCGMKAQIRVQEQIII